MAEAKTLCRLCLEEGVSTELSVEVIIVEGIGPGTFGRARCSRHGEIPLWDPSNCV